MTEQNTPKMAHDEMIDVLKGLVFGSFDRTTPEERVALNMAIEELEQEQKIGHCKDCRHWLDSGGIYRRGIGAESQCPINHIEVYEGNGYCFLFEPQIPMGKRG